MYMKLVGIFIVTFDITGRLLFIYSGFVIQFIKYENRMEQFIQLFVNLNEAWVAGGRGGVFL